VSLPEVNKCVLEDLTCFVSGHLCNSLEMKNQFGSDELKADKVISFAVVTFRNTSAIADWF
jgi:hypothetical protein